MIVVTKIKELRELLSVQRQAGKLIGLVPTMGALHDGHLSLIKKASKDTDFVVVSVFVNPTQFAPGEDYEAYPRNIDRDAKLAKDAGADLLFCPELKEMYPDKNSTFVEVTGEITKVLCGKSRPTHFKGVTTVVNMLFNIVEPNKAFFGQKDAQQVAVIFKMINNLHINIELIVCPIVREKDGLAMSSRNVYLSKEEREQAVVLSKALKEAEEKIKNGQRNIEEIKNSIKDTISKKTLAKIDYVDVYSYPELMPIKEIDRKILIALAVYFGKTRLIDNIIIN